MIKIVLADDHKMFSKAIAGLLEEEEGFKVVGVFENGVDLIKFLNKNTVDVVLTDMNMPKMDGIGVIQAIKAKKPKTKIIVLSMYDDEVIFKKCQRLGVNGYVLKDADPDELKYTIQEVVDNTHIMSFQRVLLQNSDEVYDDPFKERFKLSKRELQILQMIGSGKVTREIADELHLSPLTVESHRKKIHQKLRVSSVVELVRKAMEMKL